jgi:RNA polymerase sigma-70 factor (ECF subfamily)
MMQSSQKTDMSPAQTNVSGIARDEGDHTDPSVIHAVRNGNHQAFGLLVSQYQRRVFGLCLMIVKVHAEAEEVAQDTFVRAFEHIDRFDISRAFYPWIATIAVRLAQNRIKQRAQDMSRDTDYLAEPSRQAAEPQGPLADLVKDETQQDIWARVAALSAGQRTAVFLFYREEMKLVDVAAALGVTAGTVKTLLHRARKTLRGHMSDAPVTEMVNNPQATKNEEL